MHFFFKLSLPFERVRSFVYAPYFMSRAGPSSSQARWLLAIFSLFFSRRFQKSLSVGLGIWLYWESAYFANIGSALYLQAMGAEQCQAR